MAITKVSSVTQNSGTSLSLACSGNRPFLFVHVKTPQTSIVYNGVGLTKIDSNGGSEVWCLFNPSVGTYNIIFSTSTRAEAACFDNVSESAGIIWHGNGYAGSGNPPDGYGVDITGTSLQAGDVVIAGCSGNYGYAQIYSATASFGGDGHSLSGYTVSAGSTAKVGFNGDDQKWAAGLAVRNDDSTPSSPYPAGLKKLSGAAAASIKKISGVAIADIKKVSGVG